MAYTFYNKFWECEFDNIVSKKDKLQEVNNNRIKLEVHDTYEKDETITADFGHINIEDIINKTYVDGKF